MGAKLGHPISLKALTSACVERDDVAALTEAA
jgi:hypothetical protein